MTTICRLLVLVPLVLASGMADASTTVFFDRASWESAVGAFQVEDFETTPLGTLTCPDSGAFPCPSVITIDAPNLDIIIPPGADIQGRHGIVATGDVNGTREYRADLHSGVLVEGISTNTFVLPGLVTSFSVDLANVFDYDRLCYVDCGPVPFPMTIELAGESFPIAFGAEFFGVASTVPFEQVEVRSTSIFQGQAVLASFDNVSFALIPEPSTGILLLMGLALMARAGHPARSRAV